MSLPPAIKRETDKPKRWRSPAHLAFVRSRACAKCGSDVALEAAHVRIGGDGGMSMKPSDWRVVGLCRDCHTEQHCIGERTFWAGSDVEGLINAYCKASPKAKDIERAKRERGL